MERRGNSTSPSSTADKENYDRYYEQCLILVRKGGLIAVDNMLWDGRVADPAETAITTIVIRALNLKMRDDARIDFSLIPVGDGIALARGALTPESFTVPESHLSAIPQRNRGTTWRALASLVLL